MSEQFIHFYVLSDNNIIMFVSSKSSISVDKLPIDKLINENNEEINLKLKDVEINENKYMIVDEIDFNFITYIKMCVDMNVYEGDYNNFIDEIEIAIKQFNCKMIQYSAVVSQIAKFKAWKFGMQILKMMMQLIQ